LSPGRRAFAPRVARRPGAICRTGRDGRLRASTTISGAARRR
jgi:hypothetical protein